jgi:hypothetical protein
MSKYSRTAVFLSLLAIAAAPGGAQLRINGYFSLDAVRGAAGLSAKAWSVENLRGGLFFSGEWTPGFSYMIEPTFGSSGRLDLTQAWMGFALSPEIKVKAGLFPVPFGKYNAARRPFETMMISDPEPVGTAFPADWRELGLLAEGRFGNFNLSAFAGNGLAEASDFGGGQQFRDNNGNKGWGGRLGASLSASFEIGGSYYSGRADAANQRAVKMIGADASWSTENIRASGEYVKTTIENPAPFERGEAEGWFGLLELRFDRWTPLASYQGLRYDDPFHGPGFAGPETPGAGIFRDGTRWVFGLAYALHPNIVLKIEYDRRREHGADRWTSTFRAQAAAHF